MQSVHRVPNGIVQKWVGANWFLISIHVLLTTCTTHLSAYFMFVFERSLSSMFKKKKENYVSIIQFANYKRCLISVAFYEARLIDTINWNSLWHYVPSVTERHCECHTLVVGSMAVNNWRCMFLTVSILLYLYWCCDMLLLCTFFFTSFKPWFLLWRIM